MDTKNQSKGNIIKTKNLITQVLDPAHLSWVQGGVFKDLRNSSKEFKERPQYIPAPNTFFHLLKWIIVSTRICFAKRILFSSITPLENYMKFPIRVRRQEIGLWFTHKEGEFSKSEIRSLKSCNSIFIHSHREASKISMYSKAKLIITVGAIEPHRFMERSISGPKIVWVGTPNERKRPKLFVEIVKLNPNLEFKLYGHGWEYSKYWNHIKELKNLEYEELKGPLSSAKLDGCCIYLMTSEIEGGPMPLFEAAASGLYPICTDTGFVREIFELIDLKDQTTKPTPDEFTNKIKLTLKLLQQGHKINRKKLLKLDYKRLSNLLSSNI